MDPKYIECFQQLEMAFESFCFHKKWHIFRVPADRLTKGLTLYSGAAIINKICLVHTQGDKPLVSKPDQIYAMSVSKQEMRKFISAALETQNFNAVYATDHRILLQDFFSPESKEKESPKNECPRHTSCSNVIQFSSIAFQCRTRPCNY